MSETLFYLCPSYIIAMYHMTAWRILWTEDASGLRSIGSHRVGHDWSNSAPKNWCSWTVVLEKTLGSPLDCKEIQPVHSEGDQPWDFFGGNDAKAETPVLWPPHVKSWLTRKESDAGRDWGRRRRGWQRMRWLDGITDSMDVSLSELREMVMDREACVLWFMGLQRVRHDWATELNWSNLAWMSTNKAIFYMKVTNSLHLKMKWICGILRNHN